MTVRPNPETEPSMPKVGWPVQSAFYGRNSHPTKESSPTPCREAAQSNQAMHTNPDASASMRRVFRRWIRCQRAFSVAVGDR
jgi:hypothetical protein